MMRSCRKRASQTARPSHYSFPTSDRCAVGLCRASDASGKRILGSSLAAPAFTRPQSDPARRSCSLWPDPQEWALARPDRPRSTSRRTISSSSRTPTGEPRCRNREPPCPNTRLRRTAQIALSQCNFHTIMHCHSAFAFSNLTVLITDDGRTSTIPSVSSTCRQSTTFAPGNS
jgi:hypothetical protein